MAEDIKRINPSVMLFWNMYASLSIENELKQVNKKYDIVFFARVSKDKGIFDLLQAVAMLKENYPAIKLCVIGGGCIEEGKKYAMDLGIANNVYWAGFLPTQKDVHQLAVQAKISVLPTYFDIIPGTIIESMFLGIPVVSYHTDSIPEINEKEEVISLVEKGNIHALAKAMHELLDNPELRKERSVKGIKRAKEMFVFDDEEIRLSLLKGYNQAIKAFNDTK